jgi:hypothetical protein
MFCRFERKIAMKELDFPEYIYHYTRTENLFLILPEMRLKMSRLEETNDPREKVHSFEGIFHGFKHEYSSNRCILLIEDFMNNYPTISCFSGDNSNKKGYDLPTMWAHYTKNHNGICLKIHAKKFVSENNVIKCKFDKMDYVSKAEFNRFEIFEVTTEEEILKKLVFQKRDDWSSENEWRLFSMEGEEYCSIKKSLEVIILGLEFDQTLLPAIEELINGSNIDIVPIKLDNKTQTFYL